MWVVSGDYYVNICTLSLNLDYYVVQIKTARMDNTKLEYGLFNGQPMDIMTFSNWCSKSLPK